MTRLRQTVCRPHLEALENRWCPACDVRLIGSMLFITGDATNNQIAVLGDGAGSLHVECDGVSRDFVQPISLVTIRSGAGNDSVFASDYDFDFDGGIARHWFVELGNGDDEAGIFLLGTLDASSSITMLGGAGNDNITVGPTGLFASTIVTTISGGDGNDTIFNLMSGDVLGTMVVSLLGGNGDDRIYDFYDLFRVSGTFVGLADGGAGADIVSAGLGSLAEFDPNLPPLVFGFDVEAGGHANYAMLGGNGNDSLFGSYVGRTFGQLGVLMDGGSGDDDILAGLNIHMESTGQFAALMRGGNGNDSIGVNVTFFETELVEEFPGFFSEVLAGLSSTPAPLNQRTIIADGGAGFDTCQHSTWVTLLGIEIDQPL